VFVDADTKERIRKLLAAGWLRRSVAKAVRVSPSTVPRTARVLGLPNKGFHRSTTDWDAVREYYEAGHTIDECKLRFGFSYGAWDKAVTRGEIVPRPRANRELSRSTRDSVESMLASGCTQAQIVRELVLTKSTVAYHVRSLGIPADPRFVRRHDWAAVQHAIDEEGLSMRRCLIRFGFSRDA